METQKIKKKLSGDFSEKTEEREFSAHAPYVCTMFSRIIFKYIKDYAIF